MSTVQELFIHYKDIRERLWRPPNAVIDTGINLHRKPVQLPNEPPVPRVVVRIFEYRDVPHETSKKITFNDILQAVSDVMKVSVPDILGISRIRSHCDARHLTVYIAFKHTKLSSEAIGKLINRDHTTALYARDRINEAFELDASLRFNVQRVEERLMDE